MGDTFFYILFIVVIIYFATKDDNKSSEPSKPKNYYYNPFGNQYYEILGFKINDELVCKECLKKDDKYYEYKLLDMKEPISPDSTNNFLMGWDIVSENIYFCSRCRKIFEFKDEEDFEFKDEDR